MMLRPFSAADFGPVVSLWNRSLTKDPISEDRFWQLFLLDPNFDVNGALVAECDGKIVGFVQAMARKDVPSSVGWITIFFVCPEFRRGGIGRALIQSGLDYLRNAGCRRVSCNGYAPYYIAPGVDEDYHSAISMLSSLGFTTVAEPVAMGMKLEGIQMPDTVRERQLELQREGIYVRMFTRQDTFALLDFVERQFPEWKSCVHEGLRTGNLDIVIAERNGEIIGHTQWQNPQTDPPNGAPGRFGPFGVHKHYRGTGIGAVIFHVTIEFAQASGSRYLWFGWAGGRNLTFYERAGCTVTRRFAMMARDL